MLKLSIPSTLRLLLRQSPPHHLTSLQTITLTHTISTTPSSDENSLSAAADIAYRLLVRHHSRPAKLSLALSSAGVDPSLPGLLDRVLLRCGDSSSLALRFFSWSSSHSPPSPSSLRLLLKSLSKTRHFDLSFFSHLADLHPSLLSPSLFVPLLRRFAAARLVSRALHLLDEMPRLGVPVDDHVFSSLLDALCKHGSVREAANLFEEMRERFPPTLRHFTSLLYGWCRLGKLDEAKFVLVQMRKAGFEPDVVVYNTLLAGFAAAGKMEDGYELLREMRRKGCEPNAISYTTLIQGLCKRERMDEAMKVFVEMRRNNCAADGVTYATLINGFCKSGKISRGYEFLDSMVQLGVRPDPNAYVGIFYAHEKKEQLEECLELMERMKKVRCFPDLGVYNVVIRLACKLGELKQAAALWNEMENDELSPGLDTFIIMVHGFVGQGEVVEACGYFREMVERGLFVAPQYGVLKDLLNSLLRDGKLELAKDVWGCIVSKGCELNVCTWTIWIHALFANKHVKEACSYCMDMLESGLMPQPDTFAKLMKGLKKLYNRQIAAEITEKVRKMAEERHITFKAYKRRGVRELEEKAKTKYKREKGRGRRRRVGQGRGRSQSHAGSVNLDSEENPD
ncbi:putative pentatricopeptide repeat-containing protein At5g65820 [Typha angustifolia]|uniref:putative pentatricopeptide repeat-containing protein At5g65820 n=1 Tax=Typha angustifolia TaxID=59011 RepID=UPI003C2BA1C7